MQKDTDVDPGRARAARSVSRRSVSGTNVRSSASDSPGGAAPAVSSKLPQRPTPAPRPASSPTPIPGVSQQPGRRAGDAAASVPRQNNTRTATPYRRQQSGSRLRDFLANARRNARRRSRQRGANSPWSGVQQPIQQSAPLTAAGFFRRRRRVALFGILLIAFLEIIVFNLPSWTTLFDFAPSQQLSDFTLTGLQSASDGLVITNPADAQISVKSPTKIRFLEFENAPGAPKEQTVQYYVVSYFADNVTPHFLGNWLNMSTGTARSRFINLGGTCTHVAIRFNGAAGDIIPFSSLKINPRVPFQFSLTRICLMLLLLLLAAVLGPGSPLYDTALDTRSLLQIGLLVGATVLMMLLYFYMWNYSDSVNIWVGEHNEGGFWYDYNQYADLANSLLHGHTWLDLPVNPQLAHLKNPYDPDLRYAISWKTGSQPDGKIFWDHAFYHGKYYCYFGVVPAVLFFMPYEVLTGGHWLESAYPILWCALAAAVFATLLVVRLAKAYFRDASIGAVLLAIWMIDLGSGILYHVFTASFYSVPEASAYCFVLAALWCWLMSIHRSKRTGRRVVNPVWMFVGSFFMALVLGCRPQFEFAALAAVPIFWDSVFHDRALFSRRGFLATVCACAPFVLVFTPLMMYNKARFGSILNFGNKYQLTVFDANAAVFPKSSILGTAWYYLFQPMNITSSFPFVTATWLPANLYFPLEPSEGGFFAFVAPFALVLFLAPWIYSRKRAGWLDNALADHGYGLRSAHRTLVALVATLCGSAFVVLCADSLLGGFSQRYISDFGALTILAAVLVFLTLAPASASTLGMDHAKHALVGIVLTLVCVTIVTEFLAMFMTTRYGDLIADVPWHYYPVQSWFLFFN